MGGFVRRMWTWLERDDNAGRVIAIATVLSVLVPIILEVISLQTPTSEVRMSVPEFQDALERQAKEVREELATAHGEERIRLENENAEIARQLADVQAAYAEQQELIDELEAALAGFGDDVDDDRLAEALTALEAGDFSLADALLAAIEAREDEAVTRAAEAAFQRGQLAATRIRWGEAADHFDKAARLDPSYDHLNEAGVFAWRAGRYTTALRHFEGLLALSRREYGEKSAQTAAALSNLALLLKTTGRYDEAEPLFRQALEIGRETLGEGHPNYGTWLSNFATLLREMGRYDEAELLSRQALEIGRETLGEGHPDYATRLNNLATSLMAMGRHEEAERLFRQALEIGRETLGEGHPDYASWLSNLAALLRNMGRYAEAEPLFRQALEIDRETLGEGHPNYANGLNNLAALLRSTGRSDEAVPLYQQVLEIIRKTLGEGHPQYANQLGNLATLLVAARRHEEAEPLYRQALEVFRAALGDDHARTQRAARTYARLLQTRFPDSSALAELRATFGEDVGAP